MAKARVFRSGNSQAVRLPKKFRLDATEVEIVDRGDALILFKKPRGMGRIFDIIAEMPEDAFDIPSDGPPQKRKGL
jgi:antitoxin VapB